MTEVERCRKELERAERDARQPGLTPNARANRQQLVDRALRKFHRAEEQALKDLQRAERYATR